MKKEDAELKANALAKDLVEKEAEHKESKLKCFIASVEPRTKTEDETDYDVVCVLHPIEKDLSQTTFHVEIDQFLTSYKVLDILKEEKPLIIS